MRCTPEQKNPRPLYCLIFTLWIVGVALYAAPDAASAAGIRLPVLPFELFAVAAVIAGVFLLIRFGMTHFVYAVRLRNDDSPADLEAVPAGMTDLSRCRPEFLDFTVTRSQGARAGALECVLGLDSLVSAAPVKLRGKSSLPPVKELWKRCRNETPGFVFYDYTVTFRLEKALALVFLDGNRRVGVLIEADEEMAQYLAETASKNGIH